MGLIKAGIGALGGTLADQWKEFFYCESIDKDVLDEKYAVTNWDQGKMSMGMLEQILKTLVTEYDVIGVDIWGMYPEENSLPEYLRAERVNIRSDEELYRFLQKNLFCWASHK